MDQQSYDASNFEAFRFQNFQNFPQFIPRQSHGTRAHEIDKADEFADLQRVADDLNVGKSAEFDAMSAAAAVVAAGVANGSQAFLSHDSVPVDVTHGAKQQQQQQQQQQEHQQHQQQHDDTESHSDQQRKALPRATLQQKIQVLDHFHSFDKKSQQSTVAYFQALNKFGITKSSFNRWVRDEPKLRNDFENLSYYSRNVYKTRPNFKNPELSRALELFYEQSLYERTVDRLTERALLKKFEEFAQKFNQDIDLSKTTRSNGWLHLFKKKKHAMKERVRDFFEENSAVFAMKFLNGEKARIRDTLKNYKLCDIYHFDEFKVSNDLPGIKTFDCSKLQRHEILVALCMNADGSDLRDPVIVGKESLPENLRKSMKQRYFEQPLANMTADIFTELLVTWDQKIEKQNTNRQIVLLVDTLYAHIVSTKELKHIKLVYFSPKFASHLSNPLDLFNKNIASLTEMIPDPSNRVTFNFQTRNVVLLNSNVKKLGKLEIQPMCLGVSRLFKSYFKLNLFEYYLSQLFCDNALAPNLGDFDSETMVTVMNETDQNSLIFFATEAWNTFKEENENYALSATKKFYLKDGFYGEKNFTGPDHEFSSRYNIVSECFMNSDIIANYTKVHVDSFSNKNSVYPIVFSDHNKERRLIQILKVFEDKKLIKLAKIKTYLTRTLEDDYMSLKIEDILFPNDEFVLNKHLSDEDIIAIVKEEMKRFETSQRESELQRARSNSLKKKEDKQKRENKKSDTQTSEFASMGTMSPIIEGQLESMAISNIMNSNDKKRANSENNGNSNSNSNSNGNGDGNGSNNGIGVRDDTHTNNIDVTELLKISKFLTSDVKNMVNAHSKDQFRKSSFHFKNFLISFILESNNFILNSEQFKQAAGGSNESVDSFFSSLFRKYYKSTSKDTEKSEFQTTSVSAAPLNIDGYLAETATKRTDSELMLPEVKRLRQ